VARISEESVGIHVITSTMEEDLAVCRGGGAGIREGTIAGALPDKLSGGWRTAGMNALTAAPTGRRGLFPEQVERWRQGSPGCKCKPVADDRPSRRARKLAPRTSERSSQKGELQARR